MGDHYRAYETTVQDELISILRIPSDFSPGRGFRSPRNVVPSSELRPGYTALDGNYLSARWPGDVKKFSSDFVRLLTGNRQAGDRADLDANAVGGGDGTCVREQYGRRTSP